MQSGFAKTRLHNVVTGKGGEPPVYEHKDTLGPRDSVLYCVVKVPGFGEWPGAGNRKTVAENAAATAALSALGVQLPERCKIIEAQLQEEAEELLQTGTKKHRVRVGDEAVDGGGKASKHSGPKSRSPPASDDGDDMAIVAGSEKKAKLEKGARSIDMKYQEEEDDENQREYTAAFSADIAQEELPEGQQPVRRAVDPMDELESYQTAEDKAAIAADMPERIFDALPPGKMALKDMTDWQQKLAPRVVAYELKTVALDFSVGNNDKHLGFERLIKANADPETVFEATVAVATHIGLHLREPPFIRRYLSSCYSSVLHHEALWYIFDRIMAATALVKNAADCIELMSKFFVHDDPIFLEAQDALKDSPQYLSEAMVFDFRHHVHVMKYNEALAAAAVSSLSASDSNFHLGVQKPEVHAFLASFTLPAHMIMPCVAQEAAVPVPTPAGRYLDLLECLMDALGKRTSEQTERVVVATASKIICANLKFRQYARSVLQGHIKMVITVTPEGRNQPREIFCAGEHFTDPAIGIKLRALPKAGSTERYGIRFKDLFDGDYRACENLSSEDIWNKAPTQPMSHYDKKSLSTVTLPALWLAQWIRFEKQGWAELEFRYDSDPGTEGEHVLRQLKEQVNNVYFDLQAEPDDDFNRVRTQILKAVFHKRLIPLIVQEQKEAAIARARQFMQIRLYGDYRAMLAFPRLLPPAASKIQDPACCVDAEQKKNFRIPKIMTVCHSCVGFASHFVISTFGADGSAPMVLHRFWHQKRTLGAGTILKFGDWSDFKFLQKDPELASNLDEVFERYGNILSIVVGCCNLSTRDLFNFLDEYMKDKRGLSNKVYYFDEQVSDLIASGNSHAHVTAYLVAESLARFVIDPLSEAAKLFASRELPLIHRLLVHPEQGMITSARCREIAARVMVDSLSTCKHPVSHKIFCAQPAQARLLLQFVPGLGPRKARRLADQLCDNHNGLQTREDLKRKVDSVPIIGDVVFTNCAGFLSGFLTTLLHRSGHLSSDCDIDEVSDLMRECMDLEQTYVHPSLYALALEIAQLKSSKKGAAAITAIRSVRPPPTLTALELEAVFESEATVQLVQNVAFVSDGEARDVIKSVCRMMHSPDCETLAFLPMPPHIVFEKLVKFKPEELLFKKTTANLTCGDKFSGMRVRIQEPEMDGRLFAGNFEKERSVSLSQALRGVDVIDCVILEVDLKNFSLQIGNRRWMMNLHQTAQVKPPPRFAQGRPIPGMNSVEPMALDPADKLSRPRLCSFPWFKNMTINAAKQASKLLGQNHYLACPDEAIDRISLFVCFAPGIVVQFHVVETKWDVTRPDRIGGPLRIGCPPLYQDFEEMAEIEARFILPLISKKNEAARELNWRRMPRNTSPWALIHHEDKPGMFKFMWWHSHRYYHHSFLCSNNGFFVDGKIIETLSGLIGHMKKHHSMP